MKRDKFFNINRREIGIGAAKIVTNDLSWFVEKFTQNVHIQHSVSDQMLSEISAEIYYDERTVYRKRRLNFGTWTFEQEIERWKKISSLVFVGFMESD